MFSNSTTKISDRIATIAGKPLSALLLSLGIFLIFGVATESLHNDLELHVTSYVYHDVAGTVGSTPLPNNASYFPLIRAFGWITTVLLSAMGFLLLRAFRRQARLIQALIEQKRLLQSANEADNDAQHLTENAWRNSEEANYKLVAVNEELELKGLEASEAQEKFQKQERFVRFTLDGLGAHICVIDAQGVIVLTNRAWNAFAVANNAAEGTCGEGVSYLDVCSAACEEGAVDSDEFSAAIRAVIRGSLSEFIKEYPCHSPSIDQWFLCRINSFTVPGANYAVVSHENISELKQTQDELQRSRNEVEAAVRAMSDHGSAATART